MESKIEVIGTKVDLPKASRHMVNCQLARSGNAEEKREKDVGRHRSLTITPPLHTVVLMFERLKYKLRTIHSIRQSLI